MAKQSRSVCGRRNEAITNTTRSTGNTHTGRSRLSIPGSFSLSLCAAANKVVLLKYGRQAGRQAANIQGSGTVKSAATNFSLNQRT